jgi:hypothetical protein
MTTLRAQPPRFCTAPQKQETKIKALSIRQPWAWLIVNGFKDIENRTWPTRQTGTIFIHASKKPDLVDWHMIRRFMYNDQEYERLLIEKESPGYFGGIVGQADIIDCVDQHESKWFFGPWGFVLTNQERLDFVEYKGRLGFFELF